MIKKVGDITPAGVEIEMTDGSLRTIPYCSSSAPHDGNLRVVSLQKMGGPVITRVSFGDVPKEVISFSEIENKCKTLREEKQRLIEVATSEGIEIPMLSIMELY